MAPRSSRSGSVARAKTTASSAQPDRRSPLATLSPNPDAFMDSAAALASLVAANQASERDAHTTTHRANLIGLSLPIAAAISSSDPASSEEETEEEEEQSLGKAWSFVVGVVRGDLGGGFGKWVLLWKLSLMWGLVRKSFVDNGCVIDNETAIGKDFLFLEGGFGLERV